LRSKADLTDNEAMNNPESLHTYILPREVSRQDSVIHDSCYRMAQSMLRRSDTEPALVPINTMGYDALIYDSVISFADTGKRVSSSDTDDTEAHPIIITWQLHLAEDRDPRKQHIPMRVILHDKNLEKTQQRLTGEFYKALMLMDESYRDGLIPSVSVTVIPQA